MLPSLKSSSSSDPTIISDESVPTLKRLILVDNLSSRPKNWESSSFLANQGLGIDVALERLNGRVIEYRDLLSRKVKEKELPEVDCDEVVNLQLTSGTTGSPKAVCLSSYNLLNNGIAIGDQLDFQPNDILTGKLICKLCRKDYSLLPRVSLTFSIPHHFYLSLSLS